MTSLPDPTDRYPTEEQEDRENPNPPSTPKLYDTSTDDEDDDTPVIPQGRRFGEGQPRGRGRPPGSQNRLTILKRVAHKRHKVKIDGRRRSVSSLELVLHTIRTEASRGNLQALKLSDALVARYTERQLQKQRAMPLLMGGLTQAEWLALYAVPHLSDEEVLTRFPHLKYQIPSRHWRERQEKWLAEVAAERAAEKAADKLELYQSGHLK